MRDFFDRFKWWVATVAAIMASTTALGYTIDRPAWYEGDLKPLEEQVAMNATQIGCMHLDLLQQQVWNAEDRYAANKTQENLNRLRQARLRLQRAAAKGYVCG